MQCVLHIGTEKTGTTSLQSALSSQRDYLARNGVCYAKSPGDFNCRSLAAAFTSLGMQDDYLVRYGLTEPKRFEEWRQNLLDRLRGEITTAQDRCHSYILSSEHFSSRLLQESDVADLADYLSPMFDDIIVVCYLRRQDLMATSRINEGLRAGFPQQWFPTVTNNRALPRLYDYQALIERWSVAFGESAIRLGIFERSELAGGSVVEDFAVSQLGLHLKQAESESSNMSLSHAAQVALMMFNQAMGLESRLHVAKHRRELAKYLERVAPGSDGKPLRSLASSFYGHFKEGNSHLAQLYFQRDKLFDENFDEYPEQEQEQDIELAASLLRDFYLTQFYK